MGLNFVVLDKNGGDKAVIGVINNVFNSVSGMASFFERLELMLGEYYVAEKVEIDKGFNLFGDKPYIDTTIACFDDENGGGVENDIRIYQTWVY